MWALVFTKLEWMNGSTSESVCSFNHCSSMLKFYLCLIFTLCHNCGLSSKVKRFFHVGAFFSSVTQDYWPFLILTTQNELCQTDSLYTSSLKESYSVKHKWNCLVWQVGRRRRNAMSRTAHNILGGPLHSQQPWLFPTSYMWLWKQNVFPILFLKKNSFPIQRII